jgi:hypothetical protein
VYLSLALQRNGPDLFAHYFRGLHQYELPSAEGLYEELQKAEMLRKQANDGGAAEFFAAYDRLEKLVRSGKFPARHSISNDRGSFLVSRLSTGHDYLILAIGLKIEDEPSYYNFQKITLLPGENDITIWMVPDFRSHCS